MQMMTQVSDQLKNGISCKKNHIIQESQDHQKEELVHQYQDSNHLLLRKELPKIQPKTYQKFQVVK